MTAYTHVPSATVLGPLEPAGIRPGADGGNPLLGRIRFDTDGAVASGVWESQPGTWPVEPREQTEFCYIVSGRAIVTDAESGRTFEISAGDVIVQPRGWTGRWNVLETIRKVWALV